MSNTKELSIFVDESGDFGPFDKASPFYLFTLVFHDQSFDICSQLQRLADSLQSSGLSPMHCFHAGPIIRREDDYHYMSIIERRRVMGKMMAFTRQVDISYITLMVEKKQCADSISLIANLSKQLSRFLSSNYEYFATFDRVIVYYDNGQVELNKILASVFSAVLPNVEFKRVIPAQYRLFQVADLICTIELTILKRDMHILSKSEDTFFGSKRDMKKNYIEPIMRIRFSNRS